MKRILSIRGNASPGRALPPGNTRPPTARDDNPHARRSLQRHLQAACVALTSALLVLIPIAGAAAPLNLADTPIFLQTQVKPNIILAIDDSGSMDFEVLVPTNDGALWWDDGTKSFTDSSGNLNFQADRKYVYLFPNGYSSTYNGRRVYNDGSTSSTSHFAIAPTKELAFARSPDYNNAYYNPDVAYEPWASFGSITFGNIDPKNAPWDPYITGAGTVDLTQDIDSSNSNWTFRLRNGMKYPDGTPVTATVDDKQIKYLPATYYRIAGTPDNTGYKASAVIKQGFAPDGTTLLDKYEIKSSNYNTGQDYQRAIQNFANWFSYYRRRHLAMRAGMGKAFEGLTDLHTGLFGINNLKDVTMWDLQTQQSTFYQNLYKTVDRGGTPNREALQHAGKQYERTNTGKPIIAECQQNYTIQFTDGYSVTWTKAGLGNADAAAGPYSGMAPYADSYGETLADIAMHYYAKNVRPDLPKGKVPTTPEDPNPDPHMTTFTVGLGVEGTIFGITHNTTADAIASPPKWPDPNVNRDPTQIDDLYHAAVNGRGELLNAKTPEGLNKVMKTTLQNIMSRTASRASVALNSGSLDANSRLYQARFKSGSWVGQLLAFGVNQTTGAVIQPEQWDAGALLTPRVQGSGWDSNRMVITHNGTSGIPFRWADLSPTMQTDLNKNGQGVPDPVGFEQGDKRLEYLRGSEEHEGKGNNYRARAGKLGDIVNSAPVFVGDPKFNYPDNIESSGEKYSTFKANKTGRIKTVYVGANDGMLHGFDADTGDEILAYAPRKLFGKLTRLTEPNYAHRYYVDGTPTAGDAFWGGTWHTVLVGGLNGGGQGMFALDVSNPTGFNEGNAASLVLWEFTDANDKDLGYSFSRPSIARLHNDKWAAVFGNGYNNTENDGAPTTSNTGNAVLYMLDVQTGSVIKKLDTGVGTSQDPTGSGRPNGLATVSPVDIDGDRLIDLIYAGDLFGNLWKFDVRGSATGSWTATKLFTVTDAGFKAQPITTNPEVGLHPETSKGKTGYMVYFGTGKYIEAGDNITTGTQTQTFWGIWDPDAGSVPPYARGKLLQQQVLKETAVTINGVDADLRITTDNAITWAVDPTSPGAGEHLGWYMDLVNTEGSNTDPKGERVINAPTLRDGKMIFTTLIPSDKLCEVGGTGWLMEVDAADGSRLDSAPFDIDGDGVFDMVDDGTGTQVAPSGIKSTVGAPSAPGILDRGDGVEYKYLSGTTQGEIQTITEQGGSTGGSSPGRESWQQLR